MTWFQRLIHSARIREVAGRLTKFGSVGLSGFVVDLSVYSTLYTLLGAPHNPSRVTAYWVASTWNWFWNRNFTFRDGEIQHPVMQWGKYMLMCLVSFVPNFGTYYLLTSFVPFFDQYKYLAFVLGVGAGMLFNFTSASLIIFKVYRRK